MNRQASPAQEQLVHARSKARTRARLSTQAQYEQAKAAWISQHPEASAAEYEVAIRALAKSCGV